MADSPSEARKREDGFAIHPLYDADNVYMTIIVELKRKKKGAIYMKLVRLMGNGQIMLPETIRRSHGVDTDDQLLYYEKNGEIIITKAIAVALADAHVAEAENYIYSIDGIRSIAVPIAMKYGASGLMLFGSYARSEATPASDLDFVIVRGDVHTLPQLGGLQKTLTQAFHKNVDILIRDSLAPAFSDCVLTEIIVLF